MTNEQYSGENTKEKINEADFILAENIGEAYKLVIVSSILHFVDCDEMTMNLRLRSFRDENHRRVSVATRLDTMDKLEQIKYLFEHGMISGRAPFFERLAERMPAIKKFIEEAHRTLDYNDLRRQKQLEIEKADKLIAQDEKSN